MTGAAVVVGVMLTAPAVTGAVSPAGAHDSTPFPVVRVVDAAHPGRGVSGMRFSVLVTSTTGGRATVVSPNGDMPVTMTGASSSFLHNQSLPVAGAGRSCGDASTQVTVQQVSAPVGYATLSGPVVVCHTGSGWVQKSPLASGGASVRYDKTSNTLVYALRTVMSPRLSPDAVTVDPGGSVTFPVTGNDTPSPGSTMDSGTVQLVVDGHLVGVEHTGQGVFTVTNDGRLRFDAAPGFSEPVTVSYAAGDTSSGDVGVSSVTVRPTPHPKKSSPAAVAGVVGVCALVSGGVLAWWRRRTARLAR